MRIRQMSLATAGALAASVLVGWSAPAQAADVCSWGGTQLAPTGQFDLPAGGLTMTPSPAPLPFTATGPLAGSDGCARTMTFDGEFATGSNCLLFTSQGKVRGVPGVETFRNVSFGPSWLYDRQGKLVGQVTNTFTFASPPNLLDCATPGGIDSFKFVGLLTSL